MYSIEFLYGNGFFHSAIDADLEGSGDVGLSVLSDDESEFAFIRFGEAVFVDKAVIRECPLVEQCAILIFNQDAEFIAFEILVCDME